MKNKLSNFGLIIIAIIYSSLAMGQGVPDSNFNTLIRTENGGWVAGDATYSISLPDGRTMWLFGDSFIGTVNADSSLVAGATMIRNCAVLQEDTTFTAIYNGTFESPENFVSTLNPDTTWYWPEHGFVENDTLKIIFSEFELTDGTPGWNFQYRSAWILYFTYPDIQLVKHTEIPYYRQNGVMYGDRIMRYNNSTYIYGRKEENPEYNIPSAHIARVQSGNLQDEWEFYDGQYWLSDPTVSHKICDQAVSQQYGVFQHMDKFVMITQEIWFGSKIYSMVANQPEGPWSNLTVLYETPHPFEDMFTYNSYPHPQFDDNNELLVSYNSNGDFWQIFSNVELYRPNFIRVPYETIHPSFITSIHETVNNNSVRCYPNPARDNLTIETSDIQDDIIRINIYNLFGVKLKILEEKNQKNGIQRIIINIEDLPYGLYLYEVNGKTGKFIHK